MFAVDLSKYLKNVKLIFLFGLVVFFAERTFLLTWSTVSLGLNLSDALAAYALGLVFDISALVYFLIPFVLLYLILPRLKNDKRLLKVSKFLLTSLNFFIVFMISTMSVSELFFWDEFKARYNFIAVDYLVYTNEVLKNIWESYPTFKILLALFVFAIGVVYLISKSVDLSVKTSAKLKSKIAFMLTALAIIIGNYFFIDQSYAEAIKNISYQEIAKNGPYSLFYAYFQNQINYDQFYMNIDSHKALTDIKNSLPGDHIANEKDEETLKRNIIYTSPAPAKKMNVILVLMESMGAQFMSSYGGPAELTPNLNWLAQNGLFYNNVYATGTRTVRGIEAITLSVPPTPGQSIVRRPKNENLVTINSYFHQSGYDVQFVYGGHAYFDNMKYYFENNYAKVFDIADVPTNEVKFANAWGLSDEDIFNMSVKNADQSFKDNKLFFQIVLTTSNHRPYTFPEGVIDIPSGTGRAGAVKYADYSIGKLLEAVKTKPWFDNTIFVFVADHDASVAGNVEVNIRDYRIPLIFYAPKFIKPEVVSKLASQIDVGPTLLGLLNMSHESFGFGSDLRTSSPDRAFISNFQKVGLLKSNILTLLEPRKTYKQYKVVDSKYQDLPLENNELESTISYYQTASRLYTHDKLKMCDERIVK